MTEPQTVTAQHLRDLLEADPDSFLGLAEGEVRVVRRPDDGALEVVDAATLRALVGPAPTDEELESEADSLTVAVQQLGG
jgi:hypothetical protein